MTGFGLPPNFTEDPESLVRKAQINFSSPSRVCSEVDPTVGVLDGQPTKGSTRGRRLWPRRDREPEGETRGTQFRQVRAARCVIPNVLYAA